MFQRKGNTSLGVSKGEIIGWLSWLAGKIRENSQTVFLLEGLQPGWLGTTLKRDAYGTIVALTVGSIVALTCALSGWLINGRISGLLVGLVAGLIFSLGVRFGSWSESPFANVVMSGWIFALIVGSIFGIVGLIEGSFAGHFSGLIVGLIVALITVVCVGSLSDIALRADWLAESLVKLRTDCLADFRTYRRAGLRAKSGRFSGDQTRCFAADCLVEWICTTQFC